MSCGGIKAVKSVMQPVFVMKNIPHEPKSGFGSQCPGLQAYCPKGLSVDGSHISSQVFQVRTL